MKVGDLWLNTTRANGTPFGKIMQGEGPFLRVSLWPLFPTQL